MGYKTKSKVMNVRKGLLAMEGSEGDRYERVGEWAVKIHYIAV